MPELENFSPEQEKATEQQAPAGSSFFEKIKTKWPIVLGVVGSFTIFTAIIYGAYSYGQRGQEPQPTPTMFPLLSPTLAVIPLITPTLTPTAITPTPLVSSQGKIAFVRDGDICVINPDGSDEKQLTFNRNVGYLSWSNDGRKILFRDSESDNQPESPDPSSLWIMDVDGKNLQNLATTEYSFMTPKFSPDNSKIAYVVKGKLQILNLATKGITTLVEKGVSYPRSPAGDSNVFWTSDGKTLYFHYFSYPEVGIYKITSDGSGTLTAVVKDENVRNFVLSNDATKIAYNKFSLEQPISNLYNLILLDVLTGNEKELTKAPNLSAPVWSPDGTKVLYLFGEGDVKKLGYWDLVIGKQIVLDDSKILGFFGLKQIASAGYPNYEWSPNSQKIVAWVVMLTLDTPTQQKNGLILFDLANKSQKFLSANSSRPAWGPR